MKVLMRLAIVLAILLLVTNMAFAQCDQDYCYSITATDEYGNTDTDLWEVCLNNNGIGELCSMKLQNCLSLYLFGGGSGWFNTSGDPAFGGKPNWSAWVAGGINGSGLLQPIGEGLLLTGEGVSSNETRYTVQGMKVPCIIKAPD
jgi:hypothetical protein